MHQDPGFQWTLWFPGILVQFLPKICMCYELWAHWLVGVGFAQSSFFQAAPICKQGLQADCTLTSQWTQSSWHIMSSQKELCYHASELTPSRSSPAVVLQWRIYSPLCQLEVFWLMVSTALLLTLHWRCSGYVLFLNSLFYDFNILKSVLLNANLNVKGTNMNFKFKMLFLWAQFWTLTLGLMLVLNHFFNATCCILCRQ